MPVPSDPMLHVRLPEALAAAVATAAKKEFSTISAFTRQALLARVRDVGVPLGSDEGADAR
jgi:hypothetical protein